MIKKEVTSDSPAPGELGLVHLYTGYGKGKTTASVGLAVRAAGQGFKACVIQFLKGGGYTGEYLAASSYLPTIAFYQFGKECIKEDRQTRLNGYSEKPHMVRGDEACGECRKCFNIDEEEKLNVRRGFGLAKKLSSSGEYDLVILDEICGAVLQKLVTVEEVVELVRHKAGHTELVLTGRDAPPELEAVADYVSRVQNVKHPYDKGVGARRGVEF